MKRVEKTVFISYRRDNAPWALAIYQSLTGNDFDVFLDYQGITSGDFEQAILENIKSRAHFLVVLTPSALERCDNHGDWLRREIEEALETRRNIVPLMLEGFDFNTPSIASKLTGKLATLKSYNGMTVSVEYFEPAMTKLREKFLNVPLDAVLHPASGFAQQAARDQQTAAAAAPSVRQRELTAQDWFEKGFNADDRDEKMRCYTEAIRLEPDFERAYTLRSFERSLNKDLDGALQDVTESIRLKPDHFNPYILRATFREVKGDLEGALQDYTEAIRVGPDESVGYSGRAKMREAKGDLEGALQDYTQAIRLKPDDVETYNRRGSVRQEKGDVDGALQDFTEAIRLKPDEMPAYFGRGFLRGIKGDVDGALQDFTEAIRLKPDENGAYAGRAMVRKAKGDLDGALQDYTEAIRLDPGDVFLYQSRGLVHQAKGNLKAAQLDFDMANPTLGDNREEESSHVIRAGQSGQKIWPLLQQISPGDTPTPIPEEQTMGSSVAAEPAGLLLPLWRDPDTNGIRTRWFVILPCSIGLTLAQMDSGTLFEGYHNHWNDPPLEALGAFSVMFLVTTALFTLCAVITQWVWEFLTE